MALTTLQADVHNLILNARRLERVICSPEFEALYSTLSVEDKAQVARFVGDFHTEQLIKFIQTKIQQEVGEQSLRKLRIVASRLRITGYSTKTKEELLREILYEQARMRSRVGQVAGVESRPGSVSQQSQEGTQGPGEVRPVPITVSLVSGSRVA
jgi:hypothetical protein